MWLKKFERISSNFQHSCPQYIIFIYVLDDNVASVELFQNLGILKTNTTKIPVLVLQKLSLLDFSFHDCLFEK